MRSSCRRRGPSTSSTVPCSQCWRARQDLDSCARLVATFGTGASANPRGGFSIPPARSPVAACAPTASHMSNADWSTVVPSFSGGLTTGSDAVSVAEVDLAVLAADHAAGASAAELRARRAEHGRREPERCVRSGGGSPLLCIHPLRREPVGCGRGRRCARRPHPVGHQPPALTRPVRSATSCRACWRSPSSNVPRTSIASTPGLAGRWCTRCSSDSWARCSPAPMPNSRPPTSRGATKIALGCPSSSPRSARTSKSGPHR